MEEDGVAVEDADGCEKWTKKILTTPDGISRKTKKKKIEKKRKEENSEKYECFRESA